MNAENADGDDPLNKAKKGQKKMRNLTLTGLVVGAVVLLAGSLDAERLRFQADSGAPFWPDTIGQPVIKEWYTDLPWHQKLGTYAGNEIDEALVLPYDALRADDTEYCEAHKLTNEECMLEVGINNVLGAQRIDTLYDPNDPKIKAATHCQDPNLPCIEVKLELSSFWTRRKGSRIELQPRPIGHHNPVAPPEPNITTNPVYYGGYSITDGSTYAPQMPWYMSHYCDSFFPDTDPDAQDPVCYGDYFSPFNDGFNTFKPFDQWPNSGAPWSVYPYGEPPEPNNACVPGETKCTLAMAGFDLREVSQDQENLQYKKYNEFLLTWFNNALAKFPEDLAKDTRHFPWSGNTINWKDFIHPRAIRNPFLGEFEFKMTAPAVPPGCDITVAGNPPIWDNPHPPPPKISCTNTGELRASQYLYPRKCNLSDLTNAAAGMKTAVDTLRQCGLNYELHHNGYWVQWPQSFWPRIWCGKDSCGPRDPLVGIIANQYGRTSFLFAGVPGMQLPVSFYKDEGADLSIYERVHNASIFSLYLPITNVADIIHAFHRRNYTDTEFYHTLLMSNHMESDPWEFTEGIRGKVLWHNEYRTQKMYDKLARDSFAPDRTFAAAFDPDPKKAPSPFHNYTCDGCHVRNGSGVPINTEGKLDPALREFMKGDVYQPYNPKDYTFTGEIRPMKLVFFDLHRDTTRLDASRYSEPLAFSDSLYALFALIAKLPRQAQEASEFKDLQADDVYYNNKIMNFYGDSFHVTTPGYGYRWNYEKADPNRMVVPDARHNSELNRTYEPLQVKLGEFQTSSSCHLVQPSPTSKPWPESCADINSAAIHSAINGGEVGFMLLNGKRLGNLGAIEAIPNQNIIDFHNAQKAQLGEKIAGEIIWNAGSRDGVNGEVRKVCKTKSLADCYIGRFGWLGDRVSLEDQVANAAFVEMNILTTEGYKKLYPKGNVKFPIRYAYPNCGPANKTCVDSHGNSDLSKEDVQRMAAYARWLGNPTRAEFQVSQPEVIEGEKLFNRIRCNTCHVIEKIEIDDPDQTMLSKFFRERLKTRVTTNGDAPFLSYIGTDLLMHDMGYLSQVGKADGSIRDEDGVIKPGFENYVQKIRTPPLKGLRFNRFVTDSHNNTKAKGDPACDFLLHDGRACDAIEAAFLHDGPAIKKLEVIKGLNGLSTEQVKALRAFLYSL